MVYRKYYLQISIRIVFIILFAFLFNFTWGKANLIYTRFSLLAFIGIQGILLVNYINKTNEYLARFLLHVKEGSATVNLNDAKGKAPYEALKPYLKDIQDIIKKTRIEKENQYRYLQYLIENIPVGVISFTRTGKVQLINKAAKQILGIGFLNNISGLAVLQANFPEVLQSLKPNQPKVFNVNLNNAVKHLSLNASFFKLMDEDITLVSLQNIKSELDNNELESWQKLIRVLTHEIMNSISPITAITETIQGFYKHESKAKPCTEINDEIIEETIEGLSIIQERGNGLIDFVNKYRSLNIKVNPSFQKISVLELFSDITGLFKIDAANKHVEIIISIIPENLEITADKRLIEQVLINLVKNALEAYDTAKKSYLKLSAIKNENRVILTVEDNGLGIPSEVLPDIFIPFYTTKEIGSGIGLSLTRQIIRLHGGEISVQSVEGKHTKFAISL